MLRPTALPWRRPRRELLLLALVAVAALSPVYVVSTQDVTRMCLTRAVAAGHLNLAPACLGGTIDRASYGGRLYTDKAPGMSFLALPAAEATRLPPPARWVFEGDPHLWAVRVLTSGLAFLVLAWMVGRVAEGIAPGSGAAVLASFALGTLVAPLAASGFDHVLTAAFGFGAFVLAWRGSAVLAGLAAGAAVCCEYEALAIAIMVAAFASLRGLSPLVRFVAGAAPPLVALGVYDWAAFGSPLHPSYRYVANAYAADQHAGLLGIASPTAHASHEVFLGDRGLLVCSPVLLAAAAGLVLLARRHPPAALLCAAVTAVFFIGNCGYFLPYGGVSPGPRFLVPALPFLALGLAPAFERRRGPTAALAAASIVATTTLTLTWSLTDSYRQTVWGEIARAVTQGTSSALVANLAKNVVVWAGPSRIYAAGIVCAAAAAAFVCSVLRPSDRREKGARLDPCGSAS